MSPYTFVDLFAGCGGLSEGFHVGGFEGLAHVEWWAPAAETLRRRLESNSPGSGSRVLVEDVQTLVSDQGLHPKLASLVSRAGSISPVDLVIGGPPCQAYSIAGRIRDEHGMSLDYRNYLFEAYLRVVDALKPKVCVFENVPGLLSASPGGVPISDRVIQAFHASGYELLTPLSRTLLKMEEYGVPQRRHRLIIVAIRKGLSQKAIPLLERFYDTMLPSEKQPPVTVSNAIGHLPPPDGEESSALPNHQLRFRSERDLRIFRLLAEDARSSAPEFLGSDRLRELYRSETGRDAAVHKYHVLRANRVSNLIPAHLKKDGLRHIHYDPAQARTISVLEAGLLQGFPQDYPFAGSVGDRYQMIGNAVPPLFSARLASAMGRLLADITT